MKTGMERIGKVTQKLARFRAGLLTVSTTDVWGQIILCGGLGGCILCIVGRSAAPLALPARCQQYLPVMQPEVNSDTATYPWERQTCPSS